MTKQTNKKACLRIASCKPCQISKASMAVIELELFENVNELPTRLQRTINHFIKTNILYVSVTCLVWFNCDQAQTRGGFRARAGWAAARPDGKLAYTIWSITHMFSPIRWH